MMKTKLKRLLSVLLTMCLLLTILPVGAMAASSSVPLSLTISSYGAPFIDGSTGEHSINSIKWTKYIKRSDVGSDNAECSARVYFTEENGTYWLNLYVKIGNYEETFTHNTSDTASKINAKITNKDMSAAEGDVDFGISFNTSNGVSTYISISGGKDFEKPAHETVVEALGEITVNCTNDEVDHAEVRYALKENSYSIKMSSTTSATITVNSEKYVAEYNSTTDVEHTPKNEAKTVNLTNRSGKWTTDSSITFNVACETLEPPAPQAPTEPSVDDVIKLVGDAAVTVDCTNTEINPVHEDASYALKKGTFTVGEVSGDAESGYTCVVTVTSTSYVSDYNTATGSAHTPDNETKTITLSYVENEWTAGDGVTFKVACETPEPPAPELPAAPDKTEVLDLMSNIDVIVDCTTNEAHEDKIYKFKDNTFDIGTVEGNETDGYTCVVTVKAAGYVSTYNEEVGVDGHTADEATKTVTLKYAGDDWTVDVETITFNVTCTTDDNNDENNTGNNNNNTNDDDDRYYYDEEEEDDDESLVVRIKFDGVDENLFDKLPVDLLRNEKKYDTEDLSASKNSKKNWRYEWTGLDEDYDWSVQLGTILKEYNVTVENLRGNYWVITISKIEKPNPATGASDFVGAAVAMAVVSSLGAVALSKRK